MGERDWPARYRDARKHADNAARSLAAGEEVKGWHYEPAWNVGMPEPPKVTLEGAAWVAWLYEIAAENAETCVQVHGKHYQPFVDLCKRLAQEYREKASQHVLSVEQVEDMLEEEYERQYRDAEERE